MAARRLSAVMVARTEPDRWVYFGGEFRRETEMAIGPLVHALHFGTGAFEGIRGYWNDDRQELYLLEPAAHYEWMERSARIIRAALPQGPDMLVDITRELLRRNAFAEDVYVRPLLFKATQTIGVRLHGLQDQF